MGLDINQKQIAWNAINLAKRGLDKGDYDSTHLANYMLRDLDATKEAGLSDLSWAIHQGSPHKNDVLGLIEHLENYLLLLDDIERKNIGYDFIMEYKEELDAFLLGQIRKVRRHFDWERKALGSKG